MKIFTSFIYVRFSSDWCEVHFLLSTTRIHFQNWNFFKFYTSTDTCKKNERYEKCPSLLCKPQTCNGLGYPVPCLAQYPKGQCPGKPGCVCIDGYLRNDKGVCMPQEQCRKLFQIYYWLWGNILTNVLGFHYILIVRTAANQAKDWRILFRCSKYDVRKKNVYIKCKLDVLLTVQVQAPNLPSTNLSKLCSDCNCLLRTIVVGQCTE